MTETKKEYEYWLARIRHLPNQKKYLLHTHMKSAERVYYIEETEMRKLTFLNEKERNTIMQAQKEKNIKIAYEKLEEKGIHFITCFMDAYPSKLKEIADFPYALYVKGSLPDETKKHAAIVGARRCTPYGEKYALEFGKMLAEYGVEIISGLARGIDGMGQRGALLGKGKTFAVLGSGVDVCYPKEHMGLYVDILEQGGGILSEQPPGTPPLSIHFPMRNRIISGMSDTVLVIEARKRSGSLITADMALEQGRDIYALPGPVNSGLSEGCNQLIRQGAGILLSPEILLEEIGIHVVPGNKNSDKNKKMLESPENMVYSCVGLYPKSISQLLEETRLESEELLQRLVSLELQGFIREISKNYYIKIK